MIAKATQMIGKGMSDWIIRSPAQAQKVCRTASIIFNDLKDWAIFGINPLEAIDSYPAEKECAETGRYYLPNRLYWSSLKEVVEGGSRTSCYLDLGSFPYGYMDIKFYSKKTVMEMRMFELRFVFSENGEISSVQFKNLKINQWTPG